MVPVFQEFCGEVAIIGHENQPGGGVFEIADGIDAFGEATKKIAKRFAALRIGEGGDHLGRLMEEQVNGAWRGINGAASGFNLVL